MPVVMHPQSSNKQNQPTQIPPKKPSSSQSNRQPPYPFKPSSSLNTSQKPSQQQKNIQSTIKQLLRGKQELFNYLESQKEFMSILKDYNQINRNFSLKPRGKLSSSLTEKKKSRNDMYQGMKSVSRFGVVERRNSSVKGSCDEGKDGKCHVESNSCSKRNKADKKQSNTSCLTVQVVQQSQTSVSDQLQFQQPPLRQYQTISFNQIPRSQKYQSNLLQQQSQSNQSQQPNNSSPAYYMTITSPVKKKPQLNESYQNFYKTKYGLTNFSPWAFPKDLTKNEFDLDFGDKGENSGVFREKAMNQQRQSNDKVKSRKNNEGSMIRQGLKAGNPYRKLSGGDRQKKDNQLTSSQYLDDYSSSVCQKQNNCQRRQAQSKPKPNPKPTPIAYTRIPSKKAPQPSKPISIIKSQQVVIFQAKPPQQIFAPRTIMKQAKNLGKFTKNVREQSDVYSSFNGQLKGRVVSEVEEDKIFKTEVDDGDEGIENDTQLGQWREKNKQMLEEDGELGEMKKTEEFLKEIIISKNTMSYHNSGSTSKNNLKKHTQALYEDNPYNREKPHIKNKQNTFSKQPTPTPKPPNPSKQVIIIHPQHPQPHAPNPSPPKSLTSLSTHDNNLYSLISNSNVKCVTEASAHGYYLINQSKIKNNKNPYIRKKRHSMMARNKKLAVSQGGEVRRKLSVQDGNVQKEGKSEDTGKKGNLDFKDFDFLAESKNFVVVNPLTQHLYKKYVSIVQNKKKP